jgi:hypothetical protein
LHPEFSFSVAHSLSISYNTYLVWNGSLKHNCRIGDMKIFVFSALYKVALVTNTQVSESFKAVRKYKKVFHAGMQDKTKSLLLLKTKNQKK